MAGSCFSAQEAGRTVTLRQTGTADVVGNDDVALKAACDLLRTSGGTLVVGPGRYTIRRTTYLPANIVLRGEEGAVLALPSPVLTAAEAPAGAKELVFAEHPFDAGVIVQVLPPVGSTYFPGREAEQTEKLDLLWVERVEGPKIVLRDGLECAVPAGSRVGYPLKVLQTAPPGLARIENLVFEGGRIESIPMPGHEKRCAIWASAQFATPEKRRDVPPGAGVIVKNCTFTDWYGRAIALYRQVDGRVENCRFERIADEAIDLDHYVERFEIRDNVVRDAVNGIVLNDASRNLVERNTVEGGEIGIFSWWWHETPREGVNEENIIRGNTVKGAKQVPIRIDRTCVRYVVEDNTVDGEIIVVEPENTVRNNRRL
jgi:parallel beta-helix repeat protein